ncbi:MAG TPA: helix-turn-helix transcriptional regulator [Terrimesophilobacter sp.]|nr:helix-turn-helix transcriptional regulator [Terrimesophilobacter sp.]
MVSEFWRDLESDLTNPEFAREFAAESIRIATIDTLVNQLDEARETAGLSKAALARAIGVDPAVIRRLLSAPSVNPTLGMLAEVAAALGFRVRLEPMDAEDRAKITEPMLRAAVA